LRLLNQCQLKAEPAPDVVGRAERAGTWLQCAVQATPDVLNREGVQFDSLHVVQMAMFWVDV
jgi:hypothetical protein